jgi:cold-inducible RNA-binding protein
LLEAFPSIQLKIISETIYHFAQCGPVKEVNLITDHTTGRSRGFAFVTMETPEAAQAAISQLNGQELDGRALAVSEARPKEAGGGGGGGGGGGRSGGGGGGRSGGGGGGRGGDRGERRRDFRR